jgi:hypothetical protein
VGASRRRTRGSTSPCGDRFFALEPAQRVRERLRVEARLRRHLRADAVGLALLLAPVRREQHLVRRRAEPADDGAERRAHEPGRRRAEPRQDAERRRARHALHGVARRDVTDLVAEHARELVLGRGDGEDAARHVDVAARQRERVRLAMIDDVERVVDALERRLGGDALADLAHVVGEPACRRRMPSRLDLLRASLPISFSRDGEISDSFALARNGFTAHPDRHAR